MIEWSEEKLILKKGHTLHIIKHKNKYLGYLGFWQWEGLKLLVGSSPTDLRLYSNDYIISPARWGTAISAFGKVHLFISLKDPFRIIKFESNNGLPPFKKIGKIADGRNPFIWRDQTTEIFYLYLQQQDGNIKKLISFLSPDLDKFFEKKNLMEIKRWTLGAPSMAYFNGLYWLTFETREKDNKGKKGKWISPIYKGESPIGPFERVKNLIDAPCVFQHIFGNKYIITFSRNNEKWDIRLREGTINGKNQR